MEIRNIITDDGRELEIPNVEHYRREVEQDELDALLNAFQDAVQTAEAERRGHYYVTAREDVQIARDEIVRWVRSRASRQG